MESQEVVDFVRRKLQDGQSAEECAKALTHACLAEGSTDNMSVVVVVLNSEMAETADPDCRQPSSPSDEPLPLDANGRTNSMRRLDGDYYEDGLEDGIISKVDAVPVELLSHTRVDSIGAGLMTSEARLVSMRSQLVAIRERTAVQAAKWGVNAR